jgi:hypothetical protein
MTLPGIGDVVVTEALRDRMVRSALFPEVRFAPVELARIVSLDWSKWDQDADLPAERPKGGEPEGYVLDRRHAPAVARAMGPLFELLAPEPLPPTFRLSERSERSILAASGMPSRLIDLLAGKAGRASGESLLEASSSLPSPTLFRVGKRNFVDEVGRTWLEAETADWIGFSEVEE